MFTWLIRLLRFVWFIVFMMWAMAFFRCCSISFYDTSPL